MRFRLLGALAVEADDGRILNVSGSKLRALLCYLLLRENEVATRDALVEAIWNGVPPRTFAHGLDVLISRLRLILDDGVEKPRLRTAPGGYLFEVRPGELDADRFETGVRRGQEALAEERFAEAVDHLAQALDEWRGTAFGDLAYQAFAEARAAQLEELRIDAMEDLLEAKIRLGRHLEVLPELEAVVAKNPLHERSRALLMLALYRAGRQADALASYHAGRRLLDERLGLEPSEELRELEREILRQDPALGPPDLTHGLHRRRPPAGAAIRFATDGKAPLGLVVPHRSYRSSSTAPPGDQPPVRTDPRPSSR